MRQPDITRARTLLGWEPKVSLEEGLTSTIDYFRKKMGPVVDAARDAAGRRASGGFGDAAARDPEHVLDARTRA